MPSTHNVTSLLAEADRAFRELLDEAGFPDAAVLAPHLLAIVDGIDTHFEEGHRFYPEVVVTTSVSSLVRPIGIRSRAISLGRGPLSSSTTRILKLCGPLAQGNWTVFLEVQGAECRFGVMTLEGTELSASLFEQVVGGLAAPPEAPVVYLRGIGGRHVEATISSRSHLFGLGLKQLEASADRLDGLAKCILRNVPEERIPIARSFLLRLLQQAVREAHGCLLAVVSDTPEAIALLKAGLPDGTYLDEPIDILALLRDSAEEQSRQAATAVREFSTLIRAMIAQDGITIFSSNGRLLGFNVFVPQSSQAGGTVGGARRRAFMALLSTGLVICSLMVSQDGGMSLEVVNA
jgi:hypothetical protein